MSKLVPQTKDCSKYVYNYMKKGDKKNCDIVSNDANKSGFLYNTEMSSYKFNNEKARKNEKNHKHPRGREVSLMEMIERLLEKETTKGLKEIGDDQSDS